MDDIIKCFVCHVKTDDWRNELRGLRSQHSCTYVTEFIKKILGDFDFKRNIEDDANCICADCLNRFEEYDWTCTMAKQYEKELYELLVKTDTLCQSNVKGEIADIEPLIDRPIGDPLIEFNEQPVRNEMDDDGDLLKVMAEPLRIPKDKQYDEDENVVDSGAIDTQDDDPDFNCKLEADSVHEDSEDEEYRPQKRSAKVKKQKAANAKSSDSNAPMPKKRGRKPKNRDGVEVKPRKKREKKSYECKNCEQVFEKLVEFVVSIAY